MKKRLLIALVLIACVVMGVTLAGCDNAVKVSGIAMDDQGVAAYVDGQLTLPELIVSYSDGTTKKVKVTPDMISADDLTKLNEFGTHEISVTYEEKSTTFTITIKGEQGIPGVNGKDGASAYDIAVAGGYKGTAAEWIASLKGIAGTNGANGASAYAIAVAGGYKGTSDQWLESLKGAPGATGAQGIPGIKGDKGEAGVAGASAYDLAKAGGYTGTLEEWIVSLNGKDGANGVDGKSAFEIAVEGGYEGTETEWIASLKAIDGKSAYDIAVDNGFEGTEVEWLASLKGEKGETGNGIASIKVINDDRWGIATTTVITMTDGTETKLANKADPKYYEVYDAANETELLYLLANHAYKIVLTADIALENQLVISDDCKLDLGGKTISYASESKSNKSTIRVDGNRIEVSVLNGTIVRNGSADGKAIEFINNAKGSIEDVNISGLDGYGVCLFNGASVSMDNAKVTAKWHAVGTNNLMGGASIDIENSVLNSTSDVAVFLSSYTVTTINETTIEGNYAMHIMMGDVSVTNSELIAHSTYNPYVADSESKEYIGNSGTKENEGAAIVVRTNLYYDRVMKTNKLALNFANNKIETVSNVAVSLYDANNIKKMLPNDETVVDQFGYAYEYFKNMEKAESSFVVKDYVLSNGQFHSVREVSTISALITAIAEGASASLQNDMEIVGNAPVNFVKGGNIHVIGNGYCVTNASDASGARAFNLDGTTANASLDGGTYSFYNVKINVMNSSGYSRGISAYELKNARIQVTKCELLVKHYALNLAMCTDNNTILIKDSVISGWAAINTHSTNSSIYVVDSELIGTNTYTGEQNYFSVIVITAAGGKADSCGNTVHGRNNSIKLYNTKVTAVETTSAIEQHIGFTWLAEDNVLTYDSNCSFVHVNENGIVTKGPVVKYEDDLNNVCKLENK